MMMKMAPDKEPFCQPSNDFEPWIDSLYLVLDQMIKRIRPFGFVGSGQEVILGYGVSFRILERDLIIDP